MQALGLDHRGSIVYRRVSPQSAGQIMQVKELVLVQLVDKELTKEQENGLRKSPKGYTIDSSD